MNRSIISAAAILAGMFVGFVMLMSAWVNIPQGQVGIVFDKSAGGVLKEHLKEGWHFRRPITQWVRKYPVALRTYSSIGAGEGSDPGSPMIDLPTQEGQHIQQEISIVYNVDPDKATFVFDKFQGQDIEDIETTFIRRTIISVANTVAGKYSIMDIYGPKKDEVQAKIMDQLGTEFERWGFHLDRVNLGHSKFPESIEASLQAKVAAQQQAETAKFKLQQAEVDKQAAIAQAEGQAKANQLIQASLTPKLVELKAIEKWDGSVPQFAGGSQMIPFISTKASE